MNIFTKFSSVRTEIKEATVSCEKCHCLMKEYYSYKIIKECFSGGTFICHDQLYYCGKCKPVYTKMLRLS